MPASAYAFPPYRSTDAGTADPHEVELRLGLGEIERDSGRTELLSPLLQANLGLPNGFELISELEYSPRGEGLKDGALGAKWAAPVSDTLSIGVETLASAPVSRSTGGVGVESTLLATIRMDRYELHLNAGGFHDPRAGLAESGWRASALAEIPRGDHRFGVELFARDSNRGRTDVRVGAGLIYDLGRFDLRTGVHVGLTPAAPDVGINLWLTTSFPLRQ
ncbi:hypothetical protein [uncultured Phenylobacterium sp.]|uniref:hypothetical protein n=1 Tax=uncultured Phenylobacterium sp. TaxID=349273 RepID=UPI0025E51E3F|nr:hypothetical protein [uncultured Phenylobacterium sp.]